MDPALKRKTFDRLPQPALNLTRTIYKSMDEYSASHNLLFEF